MPYDINTGSADQTFVSGLHEEREESWHNECWIGYAAGHSAAIEQSAAPSNDVIPVVEVRLRAGKRDTSHGRARVRVRAYPVETPESELVELVQQPVDRPAEAYADYRERTLEAEVHREEASTSKEARVAEEIGLRKSSDTHQETISETVRHLQVAVGDERTTCAAMLWNSASDGNIRKPASGRHSSRFSVEHSLFTNTVILTRSRM